MRQDRSKPLSDRVIDKLKNHPIVAVLVVGSVIVIGIGSLSDSIDKIQRIFTKQPEQHDLSVSINCSPVAIPLQDLREESVYAIYLDPKWGNQLVFNRSASWPIGATPNDRAYRCEVLNNSKLALHGLSVGFKVTFRGGAAGLPPGREIAIIAPVSIEPRHSVMFYVADDTKQAQEVTPSESVSARVGDDKESRMLPVRYSTVDGRPVKLRGFNP